MIDIVKLSVAAACLLAPLQVQAQSATNLIALRGLSPVAALPKTPEGQAALAANLKVTGDIQTGTLTQPTLLPFPQQQAQALRDAVITDTNASELADGLGTTLGAAYQARARYDDYKHFTSVSQAIADLIGYTNETTKADSASGKYFFANATTDGKVPVSPEAAAIFTETGGVTDVFGKAYGRIGGSAGAGLYGNSRPFQTEPNVTVFNAFDYFGNPSNNVEWLRGPSQNLTNSPSYPSGHTTFGYTESVLLALLVPERYQQMIARAAEYGNDRIIVGAHYAMDVLGGRTLSLYDIAHLLANDPVYVGRTLNNTAIVPDMGQSQTPVVIPDFPAALKAAKADLTAALEAGCGGAIAVCAKSDIGRFQHAAANQMFYAATQTYGLPVVHQNTVDTVEDVAKIAPEAGYLLTAAFPKLTIDEANAILTATEGPGGGFLDDGSAFGLYSRLDLYAAAGKAVEASAAK